MAAVVAHAHVAELVPFDVLFEESGDDEDALEILVDFVNLEFLCIQM